MFTIFFIGGGLNPWNHYIDPITLQPLSAGRTGTLAVTDLNNFAQPRLRYLLGDVGGAVTHSVQVRTCITRTC